MSLSSNEQDGVDNNPTKEPPTSSSPMMMHQQQQHDTNLNQNHHSTSNRSLSNTITTTTDKTDKKRKTQSNKKNSKNKKKKEEEDDSNLMRGEEDDYGGDDGTIGMMDSNLLDMNDDVLIDDDEEYSQESSTISFSTRNSSSSSTKIYFPFVLSLSYNGIPFNGLQIQCGDNLKKHPHILTIEAVLLDILVGEDGSPNDAVAAASTTTSSIETISTTDTTTTTSTSLSTTFTTFTTTSTTTTATPSTEISTPFKFIKSKNLKQVKLQRACRTDRGVSAVRNVLGCVMTLPNIHNNKDTFTFNLNDVLKELNHRINNHFRIKQLNLQDQVRIVNIQRVPARFIVHHWCQFRRYLYLLPLNALDLNHRNILMTCTNIFHLQSIEQKIEKMNELFSYFEGRHYFHNFTVDATPGSDTSVRHVKSMRVIQVVIQRNDSTLVFCPTNTTTTTMNNNNNTTNTTTNTTTTMTTNITSTSTPITTSHQLEIPHLMIEISGRSFMLHQIRMMIGTVIALMRGLCTKFNHVVSTISTTETSPIATFFEDQLFSKDSLLLVPMAPSEGLFLDSLDFPNYNSNVVKKPFSPIAWEGELNEQAEQFKNQVIIPNILKVLKEKNVMLNWLVDLHCNKSKYFVKPPPPKKKNK